MQTQCPCQLGSSWLVNTWRKVRLWGRCWGGNQQLPKLGHLWRSQLVLGITCGPLLWWGRDLSQPFISMLWPLVPDGWPGCLPLLGPAFWPINRTDSSRSPSSRWVGVWSTWGRRPWCLLPLYFKKLLINCPLWISQINYYLWHQSLAMSATYYQHISLVLYIQVVLLSLPVHMALILLFMVG